MANERCAQLLEELRRAAGCGPDDHPEPGNRYIGTTKPFYPVSAPAVGRAVREFKARHPGLALAEYVALLDELCLGRTHNDLSLASGLLALWPALRRRIEPRCLDRWLDHVEGWAETDSLCQSTFTAAELLSRWEEWQALLEKLVGDQNIHKRRASLVLLTRPVRESGDERLVAQALANVERLKGERHVLITKAISWLLRELTRNHRERVAAYLEANEASLPSVAVRETRRKLLTGRK
ncbi:MAG: DNA alkylation repair protein [Anaerolineae bacterium]|nr:DNA alkylation repair protein [Anaerolineae bacterium]